MIVIEILFGIYFAFMVFLIVGWRRMSGSSLPSKASELSVSVLVPYRNEAKNLPTLLDSILKQEFQPNKIEVILIDDHSTDSSNEVVRRCLEKDVPFPVHTLPSKGPGKKNAIKTGIDVAQGEVILTTDADCSMGKRWVLAMTAPFSNPSVNMVVGPVKFQADDTIWSSMQQLEFSSLTGTTGSSLSFHMPLMCNGANLSYRRTMFYEVGGYESDLSIASGDDEFLMRKYARENKHGLIFNPDKESVVSTGVSSSVSEFVDQRIRWAGKWKYTCDLITRMLAIGILVFYVSVLSLAAIWLLNPSEFTIPVILISGKMILELIFLMNVSRWLDTNWHWISFFAWQVVYPFYALYIGVASLVSGYKWKDRAHGAFANQ